MVNTIISKIIDKVKDNYPDTVRYASRHKRNKDLYYKALENCGKSYESPIVHSVVTQISRSISIPKFSVNTFTLYPDIDSKNMKSRVEAVLSTLIGLFDYEQVHRRGREVAVAFGDVYRRPNLVSRTTVDGRMIWKPIYETLDPTALVFDRTAKSLHDDNFVNEAKWFAYIELYTKNDVLSRWGDWIFKYAEAGTDILPEKETLDDDEEFYEVIEYQNKSTLQHILMVGKNHFPVVWYGKGEKPRITDKIKGKVKYSDKYLYKDSQGVPILMLFNFHQYYNSDGIRNYGVCDMLGKIQEMHSTMVRTLVRSVNREGQAIPYISGSGVGPDLKKAIDDFRRIDVENADQFNVLQIPSRNINGTDTLSTGMIEFGGINIENTNYVVDLSYNLARHATGISPNQGEVRSNSVGQESILEEQRTLSIETIIQNNIINTKRELEGMLSFAIAHSGFSMNNVLVGYEMNAFEIQMQDVGGTMGPAPVPVAVIRRAEDTLPSCVKNIEDYDMSIEIDKDSMITKNMASHSDNLIKLLGVMNPAHVPSAYKKTFKELLASFGVLITDKDMEGIENMTKALGGMSQFQGATDVESAAGIERGPGRPESYNDQESLGPLTGALQ